MGFYISNILSGEEPGAFFGQADMEYLHIPRYIVRRNAPKKFQGDKVFQEAGKLAVITDGIILNKRELCEKYHADWATTLANMIHESEERYFDALRGVFCGAHYQKQDDTWYIYTSHIENKPIFYYCDGKDFIVSSEIGNIIETLKECNKNYNLNEVAAYDLLTYGFMTKEYTLVSEIKKLPHGHYMKIKDGSISVSQYYHYEYYSGLQSEQSDEEIINTLDTLFKKAVQYQFDKDAEYGYRHIASLSGGLDSRMTVWTAYEMGYTDLLSITFSQADYLDEVIAKKVAQKLNIEMLIKPLNDGKCLLAHRDIVKLNGGLALYSGICHIYSMLQKINFGPYGILHTGDVGDAVVGSFHGSEKTDFPGAYSTRLSGRITGRWDGKGNIEKYLMETRVFNGVVANKMVCSNYVECISPFLYKEFFEYCIGSIPKRKRDHHEIYKKWVLSRYPKAAEIPLERYNNGLLTEGRWRQNLRKVKKYGISVSVAWVFWKLHLAEEPDARLEKSSMNPWDYWYENNREVRRELDGFAKNAIEKEKIRDSFSGTLLDDIRLLYEEGTTIEKTQAITLLESLSQFF